MPLYASLFRRARAGRSRSSLEPSASTHACAKLNHSSLSDLSYSVIYLIDAATESRDCWSVKAPVPSSATWVEVFESRNILILVVDRCPFHHFRTCIAPLVPCDLVALAVQNLTVRLSERPCAGGRRAPVQGRCSPDFLCSRSLPNCPGRRQPLKPSGQARGPSRAVFAEGRLSVGSR
jgi:hypothetical protein